MRKTSVGTRVLPGPPSPQPHRVVCRLPPTDRSRISGLCGRASPEKESPHPALFAAFVSMTSTLILAVAAGGNLIRIKHTDNERSNGNVHPLLKPCAVYSLVVAGTWSRVHR